MKISELIKKTVFNIPDTDIKVVLKDDVSWSEYQESLKIENLVDRGVFNLKCMIESWNLEGEKGGIAEIDIETLKSLPAKVISPLVEKVNEMAVARIKKKTKG
jgi:hypothetical protein